MLVVLPVTVMLVDLSVAIMQVIAFVGIIKLEVSAVFIQIKNFTVNINMTIFFKLCKWSLCWYYVSGIFCSALCT